MVPNSEFSPQAGLVNLPALKANECTLIEFIQEDFKVRVFRNSDATEGEVTEHVKLNDEKKKQSKGTQLSFSKFQDAASTRLFFKAGADSAEWQRWERES